MVGTGALGSALLERLLLWEIPAVTLIDPDAVEPSNLPLSAMLTRAAERGEPGESKAVLLAREAAHSRRLPWVAIGSEIADVGWGTIAAADVLVCCTDSALSRAEVAFLASKMRIFVIDGAVFGDGIPAGRVSWFAPDTEAACYLCGMAEDTRASVLGYATSASLGCRLPRDEAAMTGTLATLERVAGRLAEAVLNFSPEASSSPSRAWKTGLRDGTWLDETFLLARSATCPWHEALPARLVPLPWELPLQGSLRPGGPALQLAWPVCTEAVCSRCGNRSKPMLRVAAVRRRLQCRSCGEQAMQPLRAVHRISPNDPLARLSPRQLGQPDRHLYLLPETADMNGSEGESSA